MINGLQRYGNESRTISSVLGGGYYLTKVGTGTLTLTGQNTYTGQTKIVGGVLKVGTDLLASKLGDNILDVINNAGLELNNYGYSSSTYNDYLTTNPVVIMPGDIDTFTNSQIAAIGGVINGNFIGKDLPIMATEIYNRSAGVLAIIVKTIDVNYLKGVKIELANDGSGNITARWLWAMYISNNGDPLTTVGAGGSAVGIANYNVRILDLQNGLNNRVTGTGYVVKTGISKLVLLKQNTYSGVTRIESGYLLNGINNAIPSGSSLNILAAGNYLLNGFDQNILGIDGQAGARVIMGSDNKTLNINSTTGTYTFAGVISGNGTIFKGGGAGTQVLTGVNTFTGTLFIGNLGTVILANAGNTLPATNYIRMANGGGNIGINGNQTLNGITFGTANVPCNVFGTGTLSMGAVAFTIAGQTANSIDMYTYSGGLNNFIFNGATQSFSVSGNNGNSVVRLAKTSSITSASLNIASNTSGGTNNSTIYLGNNNTIRTDTIYIGYRSSSYNSDNGYLYSIATSNSTFRSVANGSIANIYIGRKDTATYTNSSYGLWDTSLGTTNLQATNVFIGNTTANNGGNLGNGDMKLGAGVANISTISLAYHYRSDYNGGFGTQLGTLSIDNGGTLLVVNLNMGRYRANCTFTISGGATVKANAITKGTNNVNTVANVNWNNGTIQSYNPGTNLTITLVNINLLTASPHIFNIDVARTINVLSVISGVGALTHDGAGTTLLNAANTYSGGTTINAGTMTAGNVQAFGTGTIIVNAGGTLNRGGFALANVIVNNGGVVI